MCWALFILGQTELSSLDALESEREVEGSRRFKKVLGSLKAQISKPLPLIPAS